MYMRTQCTQVPGSNLLVSFGSKYLHPTLAGEVSGVNFFHHFIMFAHKGVEAEAKGMVM